MSFESMNAAGQPEGKDMNVFARMWNVFVAPSSAFEAVRTKPKWIVPAIIIILISIGTTYFLSPYIAEVSKAAAIRQMEKMGADEETVNRQVERIQNRPAYLAYIQPVVNSLLGFFVGAAILLFLCNIVMGVKVKYAQMLGVQVYTSLIIMLGGLVKLPVMLAKENIDVSFSLMSFLPTPEVKSFLFRYAEQVTELFNVWSVIVLIIALATVMQVKVKKVWPVMAIVSLLWFAVLAFSLKLSGI